MLKNLLLAGLILFASDAVGQITITAADMPSAGDTLRSSAADPFTTIDLNLTGANTAWDFSMLGPESQSLDEYKTVAQVNPIFILTFGTSAFGTGADVNALTGGLPLPITISDFHLFFQTRSNPSRYVARGYGAVISGLPAPIAYTDEDEWFHFPLAFNNVNNTSYALNFNLPTVGALKIDGTRETTVDGWGTIKTPHFQTPVNCIRVRSVADEIDSITFNGITTGIPRKTIEYKWLANNEPYPVLWVTASEVFGVENVSSIRYRDQYRHSLGVTDANPAILALSAFPNPASNGTMTINIPSGFIHYRVELFDMNGKLLMSQEDQALLQLGNLAAGSYLARVTSGTTTGFVRIQK
ncbi:MAG: T9SS type A sorting domain-containing protein [Sphingobacteriales bacterium]|nr:MAG: T9SS type A sorting domain-containing protein [Sphingobacteriales bacterium]